MTKGKLTLLIIASVAVFSISLFFSFVWDDVHLISMEIHNIAGLTLFKSGGFYYRPIVGVSFLLDFLIWKWNPLGYHLTNVILHTLCVILVFQLTRALLKYHLTAYSEGFIPFFTALIFAIHPIHTESVAWIAARTDILATLFFLLAFLAYIIFRHENRPAGLVLSLIFFFFSLGSKIIGIAFPFVIIAYELILSQKPKAALFSLLYLFPFVPYFIFRSHSFSLLEKIIRLSLKGMGIAHLIQLFFSSLWFYLIKSFWPFPQSAFIGKVPGLHKPLIGIIILIAIAASILKLDKKHILKFFLAFFFITLLPSLAPVFIKVVSTPLAERYLYLPSVGICFFLCYVLFALAEQYSKNEKSPFIQKTAIITLLIIAIAAGAVSAERSLVWKNELTLWRDTVRKSPEFGKVHNNYGLALMEAGKLNEAEKEFRLALSSKTINTITGRSNACVNLGNLHLKRNELKKAENAYRAALKYWKDNEAAYYNLGWLYFVKAAKAEEKNKKQFLLSSENALKKALKINPSFIKAHLLLGKVYYYLNDRKNSLKEFQTLIKQAPERKEAKEARVWIERIYKGL